MQGDQCAWNAPLMCRLPRRQLPTATKEAAERSPGAPTEAAGRRRQLPAATSGEAERSSPGAPAESAAGRFLFSGLVFFLDLDDPSACVGGVDGGEAALGSRGASVHGGRGGGENLWGWGSAWQQMCVVEGEGGASVGVGQRLAAPLCPPKGCIPIHLMPLHPLPMPFPPLYSCSLPSPCHPHSPSNAPSLPSPVPLLSPPSPTVLVQLQPRPQRL